MVQKITYTQYSDYYIPDIRLAHTGTQTLGKYGRMRRAFLEQNKVQQTCEKRMDLLMKELLAKNPAPDKATQQLAWVAHMNSLKAQAEELVVAELIYN